MSAVNRQDYVSASRILIPLAEQGNRGAQSYLGFMFETERGVPQNYTEASMWYRPAAEQGDSLAQYSLGLVYDKGFGGRGISSKPANGLIFPPQRPRAPRGKRARGFRDAVTPMMTRGEIAQARLRALEWPPANSPPALAWRRLAVGG